MNNNEKIILHLCAFEGSDSFPYREAGYDVRLITKAIGVETYQPPPNIYGIIANPPCTEFSIAKTIGQRDLVEGMRLVKECLRIIWQCQYKLRMRNSSNLKFWCIENPSTGLLRFFLGKPSFVYSQAEYGGNLTKRTGLWGMFNEPKRPLLYNPLQQAPHWERNMTTPQEILTKEVFALSILPKHFTRLTHDGWIY